jgi:Ca2+-binding EF-hand superfamily protein
MKQHVGIIAGLVFGLAGFNALAGEVPKTFEELDVDGNGYISKQEAEDQKSIKRNWSKIDTDKSGEVDISEFSAFEAIGTFTPPEESEVAEPGAAPF